MSTGPSMQSRLPFVTVAPSRGGATAMQTPLQSSKSEESPIDKHARGQFFTPGPIAELMASFVKITKGVDVRILDPGCGEGVLSAALTVWLLREQGAKSVHVDAFETDPACVRRAGEKLGALRASLETVGKALSYNVHEKDFLAALWRQGARSEGEYDVVITNPPYYKLRKDSEHARLAHEIVYGQPNVYALFLALSARLLREGGQLVAIAPRSWLSGNYFSEVRRDILGRVDLEKIHAFTRRSDAFNGDAVLQETTIFKGIRRKQPRRPDVEISISSEANNLWRSESFTVPWATLNPGGITRVVRVPESVLQLDAIRELAEIPGRLSDLGLTASTGPVVAFRTKEHLIQKHANRADAAPLIWLSHVHKAGLNWPGKQSARQPAHIAVAPSTRKLLLPAEPMILVRRFSAKEDENRVVACYYKPGPSRSVVGIENHLNVIRGFQGPGALLVARALTSYLNSDLVDQYIRAVSGTTQVNAADLRELPIPGATDLLTKWGSQ